MPSQPWRLYQGEAKLIIQSQVKSDSPFMTHVTFSVESRLGINEVEWTRQAKIKKTEILATGEACKAIFWLTHSTHKNEKTW